jgi:autophagy-related protein 33
LGLYSNVNEVVGTQEQHEQLAESAVMVSGASDSEEDRESVNGEVVRRALERGKAVESVRASIWGLAFAMGVVGLWGDGA